MFAAAGSRCRRRSGAGQTAARRPRRLRPLDRGSAARCWPARTTSSARWPGAVGRRRGRRGRADPARGAGAAPRAARRGRPPAGPGVDRSAGRRHRRRRRHAGRGRPRWPLEIGDRVGAAERVPRRGPPGPRARGVRAAGRGGPRRWTGPWRRPGPPTPLPWPKATPRRSGQVSFDFEAMGADLLAAEASADAAVVLRQAGERAGRRGGRAARRRPGRPERGPRVTPPCRRSRRGPG